MRAYPRPSSRQVDFDMAFLGDQLCSSVRTLIDLSTVFCFAATDAYTRPGWTAASDACLSKPGSTIIAALAGALPPVIRLIQVGPPA